VEDSLCLGEQRGYTGSHTNRAARIEPITPPGQVYASSAFAAVAAATGARAVDAIRRTHSAGQGLSNPGPVLRARDDVIRIGPPGRSVRHSDGTETEPVAASSLRSPCAAARESGTVAGAVHPGIRAAGTDGACARPPAAA